MNDKIIENTTGPDWWTLNPNDERYKENYKIWQVKQKEMKTTELQDIISIKSEEITYIYASIGFIISLFAIIILIFLHKKSKIQKQSKQ